jgi:hypothetical protein
MSQRPNLPHLTRVCGKVRHYHETAADLHRMALEQSEQRNGFYKDGVLSTYFCDQCRAYHVGHTTRKKTP